MATAAASEPAKLARRRRRSPRWQTPRSGRRQTRSSWRHRRCWRCEAASRTLSRRPLPAALRHSCQPRSAWSRTYCVSPRICSSLSRLANVHLPCSRHLFTPFLTWDCQRRGVSDAVPHLGRAVLSVAGHLALASVYQVVNLVWRGGSVLPQVVRFQCCCALHNVAAASMTACSPQCRLLKPHPLFTAGSCGRCGRSQVHWHMPGQDVELPAQLLVKSSALAASAALAGAGVSSRPPAPKPATRAPAARRSTAVSSGSRRASRRDASGTACLQGTVICGHTHARVNVARISVAI